MSDDRLLFELSDGIAILTLNRPEVMNAFEDGMREALFERLEECAENRDVRCVVITGAGRAFSAGGDIASMAKLQEENDLSVVEARMSIAGQVIQQIRRMPQPVLAVINGAAAGGGMNLALACDMRIASDKAVFAESFVKIGLIPDWGGFDFLSKLVGTAKAMELMMLGDRIDAAEAHRLGLVNRI
ncbi:MAG: enoyl-CoA hydratase/isomerase family protein, partial [Pseudomonadota bacterium]|nr:enoyl-CoA hydratase/isomerase family protein [Pseudomonadota bacterium]